MPEPSAGLTPPFPLVTGFSSRWPGLVLPRADKREVAAIFAAGAIGTLLRAVLAEEFPHAGGDPQDD